MITEQSTIAMAAPRILCFLMLAFTLSSGTTWAQDYLLVVPNEAPGMRNVTRPVLCFTFEGTGPLHELPSIPADLVGLVPYAAFNAEGELFLTNRQDGSNGSISRFTFDENLNYIPNGVINGAFLGDVHGIAFSDGGELFAVDGGSSGIISRFVLGADGTATSNGVIIPDQSRVPWCSQGLAFSPNGELFIAHAVCNPGVRRYRIDPSSGAATFNGEFSIPGAYWQHGLTFSSDGELFVADVYTYRVYRYKFVNGSPVSNGSIPVSGDPVGVAFSPEGELFVTCTWSGGIYRFLFDGSGNAIPNGYTPTASLGGPAILPTSVLQSNRAPVADPGGPYLAALGQLCSFDGTASFDPEGDTLSYEWAFGDGAGASGVNVTHTYASANIYDVCLSVNDGVKSDTQCTYAVVYDPSGGFVTGGGWIWSPPGAYTEDQHLEGKANFGFVSKYKKGATVPTGQTEFVFQAGDLNFHSSTYEWLVVTGSNYAKFKGTGSINGAGTYKFMLWAGDKEPDTFRIKIWEEPYEDNPIYDNCRGEDDGAGQTIAGGNIMVHTQ